MGSFKTWFCRYFKASIMGVIDFQIELWCNYIIIFWFEDCLSYFSKNWGNFFPIFWSHRWSARAGSEPKSCLGWQFNFKLGTFASQLNKCTAYIGQGARVCYLVNFVNVKRALTEEKVLYPWLQVWIYLQKVWQRECHHRFCTGKNNHNCILQL